MGLNAARMFLPAHIDDAKHVMKIWAFFAKTGLGRKTLAGVRARIHWGTLSQLHQKFAHHLREFAVSTDGSGAPPNTSAAGHLVNGCRDVVCQFLEVDPQIVHATLKFIGPNPSGEKSSAPIYTVARSAPLTRSPDLHIPHPAGHNSDFSALLGCADRKNVWTEPYSAFTCPDLTAAHASYDCSRDNWQRCYRTTVVLPLRFANPATLEHRFMGFLTFDSLNTKVFAGLPDIFQYQHHRRDEFNEQLSKCPLTPNRVNGGHAGRYFFPSPPPLDTASLAATHDATAMNARDCMPTPEEFQRNVIAEFRKSAPATAESIKILSVPLEVIQAMTTQSEQAEQNAVEEDQDALEM